MAEPRTQTNPASPATFDLAGKMVGRFVVRARLGGGGMGEVYLADDTGLKRQVALKRIAPTMRADAKSRQRMWKEAELASRLNDPHIAAVYDVVEDGGEVFVVMEYVEGETLRSRLTRSLKVAEFLFISTQCAAALAAAHQAGLLHRDIKPENIMLTGSGQVKVLDFGVAREIPGSDCANTPKTFESARISGTLAYMSPEILDEKQADARADIFSLGVVFYEALTGYNPFRRAGFLETCNAISHEDPPPLRERNSQIPKELERIVAKMLAKNPEERYVTAADLRVDLEAVRRSSEQPIALGTAKVRYKKLLKGRLPLAILAAALLVAIAVSGGLIYEHSHSPVLNEHDSILLGEFENHTDQPIFDAVVTEAVRQSLEQSSYMRLVPRSQVVEAEHRMGRGENPTLNPALAREICQRENFRVLLTGRITTYGPRYRITAQVVDPWRGDTVLVEEASLQSSTDLYPAVDEITQKLRRHFGESLKQVQEHNQPLQRVTTTSLEALQRYSRAMERYAAGDIKGFLPLANGAIELDPNFAMAHFYLGNAYDTLGEEARGEEQLALARRNLDRVTERERHLILGASYDHQGIYEKGAEQYRLITELYPDDVEAYQLLANSAVWAGHFDEALAAAQRAVQLDPNSAVSYIRLIRLQVQLNDFTGALATNGSAAQRGVKSPVLHWGTGLAYLGEDNVQAAEGEFDKLRQEGGDYEANVASLYIARVRIYEGRLHEAMDALRAGIVLDERAHREEPLLVRTYLLTTVLMAQGEKASAKKEAQYLVRSALKETQLYVSGAEAEEMRRAGALAIEVGDISAGRRILDEMERLPSLHESDFTQSCYYNLKGMIEGAAGQTESAIENQRRAALYFADYEPNRALGKEYASRGDWQNAVNALQHYLGYKGEIMRDDSPGNWVLAHLSLARVFAQAGDSTHSLEQYDEFLRLWRNGDQDLLSIREARSERERLQTAIQEGSFSKQGIIRAKQ